MKVGVLTYHRAINYGAYLQAYSLINQLKTDYPNIDFEIIDYNALSRELFIIKCPLVFSYRRSLKESIEKVSQTIVFKQSLKKLPLSKRLLCVPDDTVESYISNNYEIVIVGSDAVFNWNDLGLPNPYFLNNVNNCKKMSYSASSHLQKYHNLRESERDYISKALCDFDYLGVRDGNTESFVSGFPVNCLVEHNCDPSIFLKMDFPEDDLAEKLIKHKFDFNKKTIFLMLMKSQYGELARKYFGDDYQFVSLMDDNPFSDIYLYDLSPFEWGHVFKYGSFVVTDYFHATIFSLKNNVPVLSIDTSGYTGESYISKSHDLLYKRLNLPFCYISEDNLMDSTAYEVFSKQVDGIFEKFDIDNLNINMLDESCSYKNFQKAFDGLINRNS